MELILISLRSPYLVHDSELSVPLLQYCRCAITYRWNARAALHLRRKKKMYGHQNGALCDAVFATLNTIFSSYSMFTTIYCYVPSSDAPKLAVSTILAEKLSRKGVKFLFDCQRVMNNPDY